MTEPIPDKQTLIPQYTIRQLLIVTAGFAVVSLVGAQAVRGAMWAVAASVGVMAVAATLAVHAAFFGMVWLAYRFGERRRQRKARTTSPAQATTEPGS